MYFIGGKVIPRSRPDLIEAEHQRLAAMRPFWYWPAGMPFTTWLRTGYKEQYPPFVHIGAALGVLFALGGAAFILRWLR